MFLFQTIKMLGTLKQLQKRFENILIQYLQIVDVWTVNYGVIVSQLKG